MTWEELEMSAYQAFRITEQEHVAKNYPEWVEESANPAYEKYIYDNKGR